MIIVHFVLNVGIGLAAFNVTADIYAGFSYTNTGNRDVCFNSSASYTTKTIDTFFWDFGDGYTSNEANPCHTYNFLEPSRNYVVSLTITEEFGDESTDYRKVTVSNLNIYMAIILILVCVLLVKFIDWKDVKERFRG